MWDRRVFLKTSGLALLSFGAGPAFLARAAAASAAGGRRRTLVAIFQRGAMDALAAVPPVDDARLRRLRPRLAMSAARAAGAEALIDLGGGWALHPALAALVPAFREGRLAVVHAVGSPDPTRSHFDAQDYMESGTPGRKGTSSGWLNRVSGELGHDGSPFRSVAMTPALPRSLGGPQPALAIRRLEEFAVGLPGAGAASREAGRGFEALYDATARDRLGAAGRESFEAVRLLDRAELGRYRPAGGARYPASPLGTALRQVAQLVKADVGLEIAFAESGGWDTHVRQGTLEGSFARRARDLAESIAALWTDLGERRREVVVTTMTEFGRTARENGSGGTDHGHGSALFVLGEGVDGGRVHGHLPGLDPDDLWQGRDLPVTTDFRAVFAGLAGAHLGVERPERLFPGWSGAPLSLLREPSGGAS